jgi:flavin reductase (DIM6/NTAB) family NADH-FMN oxidoreductase RutF
VLWSIPTGLYLVGSRHGASRNLMTANLVVQVATDPKLVAVAIEAGSRTHQLVDASGGFSLSLLRPEDKAVVRRFVKPVAAEDVIDGGPGAISIKTEPTFEAATGAPILTRSVAWLDCEVRHRLALGSHELFVGEVAAVGGPDEGISVVLSMADTKMNYGG